MKPYDTLDFGNILEVGPSPSHQNNSTTLEPWAEVSIIIKDDALDLCVKATENMLFIQETRGLKNILDCEILPTASMTLKALRDYSNAYLADFVNT